MAALTVTEKEHWRDRISARIDKKIERIAASQPNLADRINREARKAALASMGLTELDAEDDRIAAAKTAIEKAEKKNKRAKLAKVRGVSVDDLDDSWYHDTEVENAIRKRQAVHEEELLAGDEVGKSILALRHEKDDLLDTVWLATSPSQLKHLWTRVCSMLGDEPTRLQQDAIDMPAVQD